VFTRFWLGGLGVDGRITLRWALEETGIDGADWIRLSQDRVQWLAFVSTVMNIRGP